MSNLIWDKGDSRVDDSIQRFTAGNDVVLDRTLLPYDIRATKAHARGLQRIGLLNEDERDQLLHGLDELAKAFECGAFVLDDRFEDGHSAIEAYLIEQLGDTGRKVHTGRSRNDQVLVALRLYMKDALKQAATITAETARACLEVAKKHEMTPMPGYTHLQRAVPSSIGMWMAGLAEAFVDDVDLLGKTTEWIDASPLGTAAGYGVNLPLDREGVSADLDFARLQVNPVYAQNSRGMFEVQVLSALGQVMLDVRRLAWDLSLYTTSEFAFISVPDVYTTGSSIMPNKRNPDVIELLRTPAGIVWSCVQELVLMMSLPSGYHRDLQATKEPLIRGATSAIGAIALIPDLIRGLEFDRERMRQSMDDGMYTTDRAIEAAKAGTPFRDAYKAAAGGSSGDDERTPERSLQERVSPGGAADLRIDEITHRLTNLA